MPIPQRREPQAWLDEWQFAEALAVHSAEAQMELVDHRCIPQNWRQQIPLQVATNGDRNIRRPKKVELV